MNIHVTSYRVQCSIKINRSSCVSDIVLLKVHDAPLSLFIVTWSIHFVVIKIVQLKILEFHLLYLRRISDVKMIITFNNSWTRIFPECVHNFWDSLLFHTNMSWSFCHNFRSRYECFCTFNRRRNELNGTKWSRRVCASKKNCNKIIVDDKTSVLKHKFVSLIDLQRSYFNPSVPRRIMLPIDIATCACFFWPNFLNILIFNKWRRGANDA